MAYNEELANRIREGLKGIDHITEKKMFGGICFLFRNKMVVGVIKDDLCARVVGEKFESKLSEDHVRPMDFTGKPLKEFVYVESTALKNGKNLQRWIELGLEHAERASSR